VRQRLLLIDLVLLLLLVAHERQSLDAASVLHLLDATVYNMDELLWYTYRSSQTEKCFMRLESTLLQGITATSHAAAMVGRNV
jgi:hypothetical protein